MIYFDNSATSGYKPRIVIKAVRQALTKYNANPGRSGHKKSLELSKKIYDVRAKISKFFNVKTPEHVIFTSGCTEAINLGIFGTAKAGGHVVTTVYEHNSVLRPLEKLKQDGLITYTAVEPDDHGEITRTCIENAVKENTYMVVVTLVANTCGAVSLINEIGQFCKEKGLLFFVDGAQGVVLKKTDLIGQNINLMAVAGHKGLYAPQGIGLLLINDVLLKPIKFGGTGTSSLELNPVVIYPDSFEVGTCNSPGILGLGAGIKYVQKKESKIQTALPELTRLFIDELSKNSNYIIYTRPHFLNGVVMFNHVTKHPSEIMQFLNDNKIYVRSGYHCAGLAHKFFKTDERGGALRVSFGIKNNKKQVLKAVELLKKL